METTTVVTKDVKAGFSTVFNKDVPLREGITSSIASRYEGCLLQASKEGFVLASVEITGLLFEIESLAKQMNNRLFKYAAKHEISIAKGQSLESNFTEEQLSEMKETPLEQYQIAYLLGKVTAPAGSKLAGLTSLNQANLMKCPAEYLDKDKNGVPSIKLGVYNLVAVTTKIKDKEISWLTIKK